MISENKVKSQGGGAVMEAGAVIRSNTVLIYLLYLKSFYSQKKHLNLNIMLRQCLLIT